ncbi:MAG: response regulator transcription factor [Parasporobacterium sp.]|nr:response regulator transcription factor [Parasporobacterium sp.]
MRILLAEDEKSINRVITRRLVWEGYSVDSCFDGQEALDYLNAMEYDAVILDVMMPKIDGFEVLTQMRERGDDTPVLFLTARDSLADKVEGLDLGADDYLVKPFEFDELMARLRVLTRRKVTSPTSLYVCEDLTLDSTHHKVNRGDQELTLTAKEFALLEYLIRNKGVVLSREQIESNLWNWDCIVGSNVVDVYIRMLRKKVDAQFDHKLIQTVRGYGYVLKEVEE